MKTNKGFAGIGVIVTIIALLAVGGIAYYAGNKTKNTQIPEINNQINQLSENKKTESVISTIPAGWREYKNDLLGFSFNYPFNINDPRNSYLTRVQIEDGETGQRFRGSAVSPLNNKYYFGFGGDSKDYSEGREADDFDFSGYSDFESLKKDLGFDMSQVSTKRIEEITLPSGIKGVMIQDRDSQFEEGFGSFIYEGQTAFFFNLPKFNGGLEFVFTRSITPQYMDIINSLKFY